MTVLTLENKNTKGSCVKMAKKKSPKKLKKFRMDHGFTIYSLADRLDVNYSTVSNWENGLKHPRPDKMMELEDMFNASYRELFEDLTDEEVVELEKRRYQTKDK